MVHYYQKRMPVMYTRRLRSELLLIAGGVATTLMAAFQYENWTAIAAAVMGALTAWTTFIAADKKLTRYTNTVEKVSFIVLWFMQLPEIEKLMVSRIRTLVDECEECFEREYDTWCSTSMARLQVNMEGKQALENAKDDAENDSTAKKNMTGKNIQEDQPKSKA